jgi:hypothetical protein
VCSSDLCAALRFPDFFPSLPKNWNIWRTHRLKSLYLGYVDIYRYILYGQNTMRTTDTTDTQEIH